MPSSVTHELEALNEANPAVYHYSPVNHALEKRMEVPTDIYNELMIQLCASQNSFLVAISSVNWREIWKYGERAFRYCQLDVGHAVGSLLMACLLLGWRAKPINIGEGLSGLSDDMFQSIFGLQSSQFVDGEDELPAVLLCVEPCSKPISLEVGSEALSDDLVSSLASISLNGKPNQQSWKARCWTESCLQLQISVNSVPNLIFS